MIRRMLLAATATATLAFMPMPIAAQERVPSDAETEALTKMMSGLFGEAEPLTSKQEARLPMAQQVVAKLFPDGTYAKMMEDGMKPMMQSILGNMADTPVFAVAQLTGLTPSALGDLDEAQLTQAAALLDPAANERNAAMGAVSMQMMTDVMNQIEPAYRIGLTRAYAIRFSNEELTELDGFFSTKTGGRYAAESFLIYADPQVMSAMSDMMPAMMEMMPSMIESMGEVNDRFPAARKYSQLDAGEQARLAELLGTTGEALSAAEPEIAVYEEKTSVTNELLYQEGDVAEAASDN